MNPYDFIVATLATWYLSYIITAQSGPFSLLKRIRETRLNGLLSCIYCTSPYVAGAVWLLIDQTTWGIDLMQVFACAGGALMLRTYTGVGLHD